MSETVVLLGRVRDVMPDEYGNDTFTEIENAVAGCMVWPRSTLAGPGSTERLQAQDQILTGWAVLLPPGTVVKGIDRARCRGRVMEVTGDPFDWASPFGGARAGVEIQLSEVTG